MTEPTPPAYRVLARKYRPQSFAELIGQDAMVRTLTNAFASGRLAHAYILTGVRGVGKTTTARIIARALNCVGDDGTGGPTAEPCGACEPCRSIAEDRNIDVLEMDAASHTGVNDIRDIIDGARYAPAAARFKVYVIDEVHMLSISAFNALLKTLEEPPPSVKFVFATTEVRRVPLTVLSRCQRFDLRRVDLDELAAHLNMIAEREGAQVEAAALGLMARAAEGSVRDGLSLLDQAIAHGEGAVSELNVSAMLGLANRARIIDLFDQVMAGDIAEALGSLRGMYDAGTDPAVVVQDLLDLVHWLTRLKLAPDAAADMAVAEVERTRGRAMAEKLSVPVLARTWQMLFKGLGETQTASAPLAAAEMLLVRLAYVVDLPVPADLVRRIEGGGAAAAKTGSPPPSGGEPRAAPGALSSLRSGGQLAVEPAPSPNARPAPEARTETSPAATLPDFAAVAAFAEHKREAILYAHLVHDVHLVRFEHGRIELRLGEKAPANLVTRLDGCLRDWTGERWVVTVSNEDGEPTLSEQASAESARQHLDAARHPFVRAALDSFPGAEISAVRTRPDLATDLDALLREVGDQEALDPAAGSPLDGDPVDDGEEET